MDSYTKNKGMADNLIVVTDTADRCIKIALKKFKINVVNNLDALIRAYCFAENVWLLIFVFVNKFSYVL